MTTLSEGAAVWDASLSGVSEITHDEGYGHGQLLIKRRSLVGRGSGYVSCGGKSKDRPRVPPGLLASRHQLSRHLHTALHHYGLHHLLCCWLGSSGYIEARRVIICPRIHEMARAVPRIEVSVRTTEL